MIDSKSFVITMINDSDDDFTIKFNYDAKCDFVIQLYYFILIIVFFVLKKLLDKIVKH